MDNTSSTIALDLSANEYIQGRLFEWGLLELINQNSNGFSAYDGNVTTFNIQNGYRYSVFNQDPDESFKLKSYQCLQNFLSKKQGEMLLFIFPRKKVKEFTSQSSLDEILKFVGSLEGQFFAFLDVKGHEVREILIPAYNNKGYLLWKAVEKKVGPNKLVSRLTDSDMIRECDDYLKNVLLDPSTFNENYLNNHKKKSVDLPENFDFWSFLEEVTRKIGTNTEFFGLQTERREYYEFPSINQKSLGDLGYVMGLLYYVITPKDFSFALLITDSKILVAGNDEVVELARSRKFLI